MADILPYKCEKVRETLERLEATDNASPSEALEILLKAKQVCDVSCIEMCNNCQKKTAYNTIKQALLERIVWKNIHNTKVRMPLCDVFNNPTPLSKEERYKYIEHIYYHWEEMKESLEDKIVSLQKELKQTLLKAQEQKQYIKWEDLEFKEESNVLLVRMGDNVYKMTYRLYENEGCIRLEDCQRIYLELFANEKKFFNDLHLERVEVEE